MSTKVTVTLAVALISIGMALAPAPSSADNTADKHNTMQHGTMQHGNMAHQHHNAPNSQVQIMPTEPGQGAFAAIAEIVALLTKDPTTDWSKVNINLLREHLVDMDELTLRAKATTKVLDGKVEFTITGKGRTLVAIQRMVPAHSGVLTKTTAWKVDSKLTKTGAIMTVSSSNPKTLEMIKALGFFGVMATGAHHQAHHLAMAKGNMHVHQ